MRSETRISSSSPGPGAFETKDEGRRDAFIPRFHPSSLLFTGDVSVLADLAHGHLDNNISRH